MMRSREAVSPRVARPWFAVAPASLDVGAALLAAIAAGLVFWRHVNLIATVAIMAALGVAWRMLLAGA